MKNNRIKLTEVETMNEISLQELLDLSTGVQTTILKLQTSALKFNNKRLQMLATKLSSGAGEFHNMIADLVMSGDATDEGAGQDEVDPKIPLEQPSKLPQNESAKAKYLKRKALKEADETSEDTEGKEYESDYDPSKAELVIDLTKPFEHAIDGLEDEEFTNFKSEVIGTLEDKIDTVEDKLGVEKADEYASTIEAMDKAKQSDDFDYALNRLYDFADKNEILVETYKSKKTKL